MLTSIEGLKSGINFQEAFKSIANFHERSSSETVLFSGTHPGDLVAPSADTIERLARNVGLWSHDTNVGNLLNGNDELPALLEVSDGNFVALLNQTDTGDVECVGWNGNSKCCLLPTTVLGSLSNRSVYSLSRVYMNDSAETEIGYGFSIEKRHWFFGSISKFWRSYSLVALAALFINLIALASPLFVMNVYDRVLPNEAISTLWVLAVGVSVALLFDMLLKFARAAVIDYTGRKLDLRLSQLIYEKILSTTMGARPYSTGEYANRASQYEFVREFFSSNTVATLIDTVFIFIFLLTIWLISGWLVIVPTLAFLIVVIIGFIAQYRIANRMAAAANEAAQRQSLLVESIAIAETVKNLRAEGALLKRWRELTVNSTHTSEQIKQITSGATTATQFVQQLVTVCIVLMGAYQFKDGVVSMGAIIATVILSGRAMAPLGQLAMTIARYRQVLLSLTILNAIMEQPDDVPSSAGFVNRLVSDGGVRFDNVSFKYDADGEYALSDVSFNISPGERVGVIGRIGSGKSTLGRLLGALYVSDEGRVLIDKVDVRQYHPSEVRSAVAVAGQSGDLFSGTIKENLLLANPNASDDDILHVSKLAGIDEFVSRNPKGYDMQVGENGSALSMGQKQSVTIARLLLSNPKIVFLDEPSGAMDLSSERQLIANLKRAFSDKQTLILATHRYSMLDLVDRLLVLDNGRLIADGPKREVIEALKNRVTNGGAS